MNEIVQLLRKENRKLVEQANKLKFKLDIALQGLDALYLNGETTGIAKATLDEIKNTDNKDLSQETEKNNF
mgnify:CR=1 FL=1